LDEEYKENKHSEIQENSNTFDGEKFKKQDMHNIITIPFTYKMFEEDLYKTLFKKISNRENIFEVINQSTSKVKKTKKSKIDKFEITDEKITSQIESINYINQESIAIIENEVAPLIKTEEPQKNEVIEDFDENFDNILKPITVRPSPSMLGNKIIINNYYNIFNQTVTDPRTTISLVQNISQQLSDADKNIVIINGINPSSLIDEETVKPKSNILFFKY
jgi:hypothetical protein